MMVAAFRPATRWWSKDKPRECSVHATEHSKNALGTSIFAWGEGIGDANDAKSMSCVSILSFYRSIQFPILLSLSFPFLKRKERIFCVICVSASPVALLVGVPVKIVLDDFVRTYPHITALSDPVGHRFTILFCRS